VGLALRLDVVDLSRYCRLTTQALRLLLRAMAIHVHLTNRTVTQLCCVDGEVYRGQGGKLPYAFKTRSMTAAMAEKDRLLQLHPLLVVTVYVDGEERSVHHEHVQARVRHDVESARVFHWRASPWLLRALWPRPTTTLPDDQVEQWARQPLPEASDDDHVYVLLDGERVPLSVAELKHRATSLSSKKVSHLAYTDDLQPRLLPLPFRRTRLVWWRQRLGRLSNPWTSSTAIAQLPASTEKAS